MARISVIMPVYNAGNCRALDLAIESILTQNAGETELILCDDSSTDGTWEHLQRWKEKDSRIVLLRTLKNAGPGTARNLAFKAAKGAYIALMDADDVSVPGRLRAQCRYLEETPDIDFVGTKGEFFSHVPGDMKRHYHFIKSPRAKDFLMTLPFVHASIMFRRELFLASGGYSEQRSVTRSEDYDFLMKLYSMGYAGANLDETLYCIRLDENAYQRRKYRYRLNECIVRWRGFRRMGLMPAGIPYTVKPLIVGLIPHGLLEHMKSRYYRN